MAFLEEYVAFCKFFYELEILDVKNSSFSHLISDKFVNPLAAVGR